jgi:hypothetical protein
MDYCRRLPVICSDVGGSAAPLALASAMALQLGMSGGGALKNEAWSS